MWFYFALLSAVLASFRKVNDKHLSHSVHHMHLAWMNKLAAVPVLGVAALLTDQLLPDQPLSLMFWASALLCIFVTTPLDTAVYLRSLKHGQLSKTAPLLSLWPVVMLIVGVLFFGQIPSLPATLAVMMIVCGIYLLNVTKGSWNVFKNIWSDRGMRFGVLGIGTVSLNTSLGAVAVLNSAPLFLAFWACVGGVIVQLIYAQAVAPGQYKHSHKSMIIQNGSLQGVANVLYFSAIATGPLGYVTAIRSLSSTFSAVIGARVFNEGINTQKSVALALIALGAVLVGVVS